MFLAYSVKARNSSF